MAHPPKRPASQPPQLSPFDQALAAHQQGQWAAAGQLYAQVQPSDNRYAMALHNHGVIKYQLGDYAGALDLVQQSLRLIPGISEWMLHLADILYTLGQMNEAIAAYDRVLARDPKNINAWNMKGGAHWGLAQYKSALECWDRVASISPQLADAWSNRGEALRKMGQCDLALASQERALQIDSKNANAWCNRGFALYDKGLPEEALASLEKALALGNVPSALSLLPRVSSELCNWRMCSKQLAALQQALEKGNSGIVYKDIEPFMLLRFPFSLAQLQHITERRSAVLFSAPQPVTPEMCALHIGKPRPPRLRIGYFSADFHNHATMLLMAGLFEAHDKARFETVGICTGRYGGQPDDAMRIRAKQAFDRFEVAGDLDDDQLLRLARTLDLHIAVDLKGHTKDSRMGVFAPRVAPIQMHYLGYPGTLGMPGAIDYLVADRVLIPEFSRPFYSEKIIELPDSYQVNDQQRAIDPVVPSRIELGLPENAFVFCSFNNNYKITQEVFGLWMQLLLDKPNSVLWLLASNDAAARNLKQAAQEAGIDPDRIIFAQRAGLPQHLARHAQADLFLDTWPYNAHTTTSDALWAGLPVLTRTSETFASRVGASLLTACNLPELITDTPQDYLNRAKELAHDPRQLGSIRRKLQDTRMTVPLFDTVRFTRHLEKAYDMAWERFAQGLPPDHIIVPALATA